MTENWITIAEKLKFADGKSWTETAAAVSGFFPGKNPQQVLEAVRGKLRRTDTYKTKGKITFEDKPCTEPQDIDAYYEQLKALNRSIMSLETKQTKATIRLDEQKPTGIIFWGDWHFGVKGCDYDLFDQDEALITKTDGLYIVGMGDYKDNGSALVHQGSTQESIATTDMQDMIVLRKFERTADKHIVTIRGCHDDWDKRNANKDFIQSICDITGAVNLWHGGIINLTVGNIEYRIGARHKYKFESSLNTTNTQRAFTNEYGHCDIVALAHKHFCEIEHTQRMGNDTVYLRSGSYKRYDEFGQKLAGYSGIHGVPMVILSPDKKEMIPFRNLEDGIETLNRLRA